MDTTTPTQKIVSIGYEQRDIDELVDLLRKSDVEMLIDVRLHAVSRKPGFSKTALGTALGEAGIDYRHERALGNPRSNRDAFRRGDPDARRAFVSHLHSHGTEQLATVKRLAEELTVALMCYEREHATCHRSSIVDEAWSDEPAFTLVKI